MVGRKKSFEDLSVDKRLHILNRAVSDDADAAFKLDAHPNLPGRYALIAAREAVFLERAGVVDPSEAFALAERIMAEGARIGLQGAGIVREPDLRDEARSFDPNTLL